MSDNQDIRKLMDKINSFAIEREWEQFHTPKNLVMALSVEASELLEIYQWHQDSDPLTPEMLAKTEEEIADVFNYLLRLCSVLDIDLIQACEKKLAENEEKYPANLVKGSSKKYSEY